MEHTNIYKKVLLEKGIVWNDQRNRLFIKGIQLPPFEQDSYPYLPNQDLNVQHKTVLTNSGDYGKDKNEVLIGQLHRAFAVLLVSEAFPGIPVKDILKTLEEIENVPEAG